jgi:hypothetical protein
MLFDLQHSRVTEATKLWQAIVLEETGDSVILKVEKNDTLGNLGQVTN